MQLVENSILAALYQENSPDWLSELELVFLPQGQTLAIADAELQYVYFPTTAILSLCNLTEDGHTVAVATIGNEGVVGVIACLGGRILTSSMIVQSAGHAYRLRARTIAGELSRNTMTTSILLRYTHSLIADVAQTAVCYRHHVLEQQLCTWMLRTLDRLPGGDILITHELLGKFMGVRRESITEIALKLQFRGLIQYSRGRIRVLRRRELEGCACECFKVRQRQQYQVLPRLKAA